MAQQMVPVSPRISHDEARTYCRAFAERVTRTAPDRYTLDPAPEQRIDRLYLDYLRNGRGNTAVGAYSHRVRASLPVAAPVTWKDVEGGIAPDAFSMARPPRRG